jgi:hypothetical protein
MAQHMLEELARLLMLAAEASTPYPGVWRLMTTLLASYRGRITTTVFRKLLARMENLCCCWRR